MPLRPALDRNGARGHSTGMSDDKPKPMDDLKEGLGLLFRAAKGAVEKLPTTKVEEVAKDAVKEVTRAFDTIEKEIEKAFGKEPSPPRNEAPPPEEKKWDDGYAPEPPRDDQTPRGPRVS